MTEDTFPGSPVHAARERFHAGDMSARGIDASRLILVRVGVNTFTCGTHVHVFCCYFF